MDKLWVVVSAAYAESIAVRVAVTKLSSSAPFRRP
jgi:hypothetical protein